MSIIDERKKFIDQALRIDHHRVSFADLCKSHNITTKTGYKWLGRFKKNGEPGLENLSRAPLSNPSKISKEVELAVIAIRNEFPKWGPKKIRTELINHYSELSTPSEGSIGNILSKNNLSKHRIYRRHVAQTAPLGNCNEPNDTWMYDFKGWFKTGNGQICEPLTVTDGFSRYLLHCQHIPRKRGCDVWEELEQLFYQYGLPKKIRSDNGPPFASLSVGRLSAIAIKLIKIGVTPEWIDPGCPEQNGRHERFHLTLKNETADPPALTPDLQDERFIQFQKYYNNRRYHEALDQQTPASVYRPSLSIWDGKFRTVEYPTHYETRKVCAGGLISWKGNNFFISEILRAEYVGLTEIEEGILDVYFGPILLGKINKKKEFKRL
jgi:transposase InsO family protein